VAWRRGLAWTLRTLPTPSLVRMHCSMSELVAASPADRADGWLGESPADRVDPAAITVGGAACGNRPVGGPTAAAWTRMPRPALTPRTQSPHQAARRPLFGAPASVSSVMRASVGTVTDQRILSGQSPPAVKTEDDQARLKTCSREAARPPVAPIRLNTHRALSPNSTACPHQPSIHGPPLSV
jgi:hypothetical protein